MPGVRDDRRLTVLGEAKAVRAMLLEPVVFRHDALELSRKPVVYETLLVPADACGVREFIASSTPDAPWRKSAVSLTLTVVVLAFD